jgi:cytochrome P450
MRRLGGAPEIAVAAVVGLAAYLMIVVGIALVAPVVLWPLALVALCVIAYAWWRSRPDFGRGRGLPPGSLRIAPLDPWTDQDFFARQASQFGPIFKTSVLVSPVVCVVGLPIAMDLFRSHDLALAPPPNRFGRFIPRGFVRSMSFEDHANYLPVLRSAVSGSVTRHAEPELRGIVRDTLGDASAGGRPADVRRLARSIIRPAFYLMFFGIRPADPDARRLDRLYEILDPLDAWRHLPRRIGRAVDEIAEIVGNRTVDEDTFLAAARRAHPEAADDPTFVKNLVYLLQVSASDVGGLLAWVMHKLALNPKWLDNVRDDEGRGPAARRVVMETLRLEQSEFITRRATSDIRWAGYVIPKGTRVRVCVRESHRDPDYFERPDSFDPDRWLTASAARDHYSPFGASTSRSTCLGEGLTLTIGSLFVEELATGFDMAVVADGPVEFSGIHWRPNQAFTISLAARG